MLTADTQWIMSLAGNYPALDIVAILFAEYIPYVFIILLAAVVLLQHNLRRRVYLAAFTGISVILSFGVIREALQYFMYRPRPFVAYSLTPLVEHAADGSFPSGHATIFFTLATIVFLFFSRRWGIAAYVIAGLIGLARVYAALHYPLDIGAGALIGIAAPFLVRYLLPPRLMTAAEESAEDTAHS